MYFKDEQHKENYYELVEQMYLSEEEIAKPDVLLRGQLAFSYLIALYQEDYERYEGERFYIEIGEELSIGGPTYLLEDEIGERRYEHEKILLAAKQILKGEVPERFEDKEKMVIDQALKLRNGIPER